MIKVLQIIDSKSFTGISKLMYNVEKNIAKDIKFDFLTATNVYDKWNNLNISRKTFKGRMIYNYRLFKYLKNNSYDIIHINSGAFFFTFKVVIISRIAKIKKVIVHSHNTPHIKPIKRILIKILNPFYNKMINKKLTCSNEASKSLFTKLDDVVLVKNGINIDEFKYDEKAREEYRKMFNIEKKVVYGNVGRLSKQKNHNFLIDVFYEIQKHQEAILLLVGEGELIEDIKDKINRLNIKDKVIFCGFRNDVNKILNAIDIFIFPSIYEGLPVALIEAQTTGLPVVVSNNITDEAKIIENFIKIQSDDAKIWAKRILEIDVNKLERKNKYKNTINKGYDIKQTTKQLEQIYRDLIKNDSPNINLQKRM